MSESKLIREALKQRFDPIGDYFKNQNDSMRGQELDEMNWKGRRRSTNVRDLRTVERDTNTTRSRLLDPEPISKRAMSGGKIPSTVKQRFDPIGDYMKNQNDSIQEEIAINLYDELNYVMENYGEEAGDEWIANLSEEQLSIMETAANLRRKAREDLRAAAAAEDDERSGGGQNNNIPSGGQSSRGGAATTRREVRERQKAAQDAAKRLETAPEGPTSRGGKKGRFNIPVPTPSPIQGPLPAAPQAATPAASHTVKKGENLWNIVKGRGKNMSNADIANEVNRLAKLNKMKDPNKIMPGQEIKFEETKITDKFLEAFDKVITSKHSNIFQEAKGSKPKTAKEKELAALAEPKDKITHKDVLVGRGVVAKEEKSPEEYDVTGSGVMTYTDPKTGEKKDKIPDIHMKGYKTLPTKNIPVPTKRPKNMDESIFSEEEIAYFEGVGKIAGKPNDKSVPAGKDTSNATGSRSGTLSDEYVGEGRRGRPPKGESLGANELHMNAKRAADNMNNITHTFANGQKVKMTKAMGTGFLARHLAAKTADDKDAILNHAHSSLSAFKDVVEGKPIPEKKKKGISLAGNM